MELGKKHINEIYSKSCARLNVLRLLKHNLDRKSLEKLYFGFIRPILEYGNMVWDNCTKDESDLIESVQYEAARIVSGLRRGTARTKLYKELGWDSLQSRCRKQKLVLVFKALHGFLPNYLSECIISNINLDANYALRNPRFFNLPKTRTQSYKNSFFPCALDLWNKLDNDTQNIPSLSLFKKKLNEDIVKPPSYFCIGHRRTNIIYCQLRNEVSNLNHHLFMSHLSDSPQCACGDTVEDSFHYFYVCPLYLRHRSQLFKDLQKFIGNLTVDILLNGSPDYSIEDNTTITNAVLRFIDYTGRFA